MTNWLFIVNSIVRYAENNVEKIISGKKIKFEDVLDYYKKSFPKNAKAAFLSEYLKGYYNERCTYFKKDFDRGDYASVNELKEDKGYIYNHNGVTFLF